MAKTHKMIHPINVRTKCEVYNCKNRADYLVGNPMLRMSCIHLCKECLTQIAEEAHEEKIMVNEEKTSDVDVAKENETVTISGEGIMVNKDSSFLNKHNEQVTPADGEADERAENGVMNSSATSNTDSAEPPAVYTCKYCGKTFPKPDGLSEYKSHIAKCRLSKGN